MPGASAAAGAAAAAGALVPPPSLELLAPERCPECGSGDVIEDRGEGNSVCRGCGLVVQAYLLDAGAEWRSFGDDDGPDKSRIGAAANPLLEEGLGTDIAGGAEGAAAGGLRVRTQLSAADRAVLAAGRRIDEWGARLSAPSAGAARAKELYALWLRATKKGARGGEAVVAACLFIGLRQAGAGRTFDEVGKASGVGKRRIGAMQRQLEKAVPAAKSRHLAHGGGGGGGDGDGASPSAVDEDAVMRYCHRVDVPRAAYASAARLARALAAGPCRGRTPATICGLTLFVVKRLTACRDKALMATVAQVVGISPATVLDAYKKSFDQLPAMVRDLEHLEPASRLPEM